jgi:pentapeptide repeat protein
LSEIEALPAKNNQSKRKFVPFMNAINARLRLEDFLRNRDWDFTVDVIGDFANVDLSNWNFKEWNCLANFSGNFLAASFAGAILPGGARPEQRSFSREPRVSLSGNFQSSDFRGATLVQLVLSGDFTEADFRETKFIGCTFSGKFTRANLGATFDYCTTLPQARFDEAILTNAFGLECNVAQVAGARTGPNGQILIPSGRNIEFGNTEYQIMRVHGFSENVAEPDFHRMRSSMVDNADFPFRKRILELRHKTIQVDQEIDDPQLQELNLVLDAQEVNLTGIRSEYIDLVGNYCHTRIAESPDIRDVTLRVGRFDGLDLSQLRAESLHICMDRADFGWIQLPTTLKEVTVQSVVIDSNFMHRSASVRNIRPCELAAALEAWSNSSHRSQVISSLLCSLKPRLPAAKLSQIFRSNSMNALSVLKQKSIPSRGQLLMAALLTARPNFENWKAQVASAFSRTSPAEASSPD